MNQMELTITRMDSRSSNSTNIPRPVRGQEKDRSDSTRPLINSRIWKLLALPVSSQADDGLDSETLVNNFDSTILLWAIDPANAYHVTGVVNNMSVRFMIDTGAAVSLIRKDVWEKLVPKGGVQMEAWTKNLVGVEGSPLSVLGATSLNIT